MNDTNLLRLKTWSRNGAIVGLIAGLLNSVVLGKGGYALFSLQNFAYIFGHIVGAAILALLAASVTNALAKD